MHFRQLLYFTMLVFAVLFSPAVHAESDLDEHYVKPVNDAVVYYRYDPVQSNMYESGILHKEGIYNEKGILEINGDQYYLISYLDTRFYVKTSTVVETTFHPNQESAPVLAVDNSEPITNEYYVLYYAAPGADDVQLWYNRDGMDYIAYERFNAPSAKMIMSVPVEQKYYVRALYHGVWINSNQVSVTVSAPYGNIDETKISAPFRVDQGEPVVFSVEAPPHTRFKSVSVSCINGGLIEGIQYFSEYQKNYTVETYQLSCGKYIIQASVDIEPGYTGVDSARQYFYIGDVDMSVSLTADKTKILTGTELMLYCSAKNAEEVWLYKKVDEYNGKNQWRYWNNGIDGVNCIDQWLDTPQTITYWLEARFGNEIVLSEPLEISVLAPYGRLQKPVIHIPYSIPQGEQIIFTVDPIPHADIYYISIRDNQGELYYQSFDAAQAYSGEMENIILSPERETEGTCTVFIRVRGKGATENYLESYFHVGEIDKQTRVMVDRKNVLTNEEVMLSFYAPNADRYQIYEKNENDESIFSYGIGGVDLSWPKEWDEPQTVTYTLKALYGETWREASATIQVGSCGQLNTPVVTVPYQADYGQPVTFSVEQVRDGADYDIRVWKKHGSGANCVGYYQQPGSYTLDHLKKGAYYIEAVVTEKGWQKSEYTGYFHVGEIDRTIDFYAATETVKVQEEYYLYYHVKEADKLTIKNKNTEEVICDHIFMTDSARGILVHEEEAGTVTYELEAIFGSEIIRKEVTVLVTGGEEQLNTPVVNVSGQAIPGKDVILNIDTVPNAQQYIFDVYENNMFCQGGFTKENTITLIADFLPFHGMIRIEVKASGEGYKDSEPSILNIQIGNEITIPILKNLQTFVMPRSLIHVEEQGFEGVGAERIILQDSIKTINSCSFANCKNLQYINLPDSLTYIASDAFEGCDNLFIECSAGSLGEEFARAHGFYPVLK